MSNGGKGNTSKKQSKKSKASGKQSTPTGGVFAEQGTRDVVSAAKANSQSQVGLRKAIKSNAKITKDDLAAWFYALARPFSHPAVQCPVNYNPVPSIITSLGTTEYLSSFEVAAGESRQITLFPGHSYELEDLPLDNMDATSYHAPAQLLRDNDSGGGVLSRYSVGPINVGGIPSAIGYISEGTTGDVLSTNSGVVGSKGLFPAVSLPYTGQYGQGYHSRWKLTAMGMRLVNTTPEIQRGGYIESVQPTSKGSPVAFSALAVNPTYAMHEANTEDKPIEISWIPRLQDLAYWHTENTESNDSREAGLRVRVSAPATAQSYRLEVICHWQLAGNSLLAIGTPTIHRPLDRAVVEPGIDHLANTSHTAAPAVGVAAEIARTMGDGIAQMARVAGPALAHKAVSSLASYFGGA